MNVKDIADALVGGDSLDEVFEKLSPTNPVVPNFPGGDYAGDNTGRGGDIGKYAGDNTGASFPKCPYCNGTGQSPEGGVCPYCANQRVRARE